MTDEILEKTEGAAADDSERFKPFEAEIERLRGELKNREARENEYLATIRETATSLARRNEPEAKPERDILADLVGDAAEQDLDPEKLMEALAKDPKAALAKMGLMTRTQAAQMSIKAAERIADRKIAEIEQRLDAKLQQREAVRETDLKLYKEFPELKDEAFLASVQAEMNDIADGDKSQWTNPALIRAACRTVKATLGKGEKTAARNDVAGRLAMQTASRNREAASAAEPSDAVMKARSIAERMQAAGHRIKPEDIK